MYGPEVSTCTNTGALVFSTPAHVKESREQLAALQDQNEALKAALAALVAAQPASVRTKLPKELLELAQNTQS